MNSLVCIYVDEGVRVFISNKAYQNMFCHDKSKVDITAYQYHLALLL